MSVAHRRRFPRRSEAPRLTPAGEGTTKPCCGTTQELETIAPSKEAAFYDIGLDRTRSQLVVSSLRYGSSTRPLLCQGQVGVGEARLAPRTVRTNRRLLVDVGRMLGARAERSSLVWQPHPKRKRCGTRHLASEDPLDIRRHLSAAALTRRWVPTFSIPGTSEETFCLTHVTLIARRARFPSAGAQRIRGSRSLPI